MTNARPLPVVGLPSDMDPGIRGYVEILQARGVETCQSCEGGPGHSYPVPTIEFDGDRGEGFRALGIALTHALPVSELRRTWSINEMEPAHPVWVMVFWKKADSDSLG